MSVLTAKIDEARMSVYKSRLNFFLRRNPVHRSLWGSQNRASTFRHKNWICGFRISTIPMETGIFRAWILKKLWKRSLKKLWNAATSLAPCASMVWTTWKARKSNPSRRFAMPSPNLKELGRVGFDKSILSCYTRQSLSWLFTVTGLAVCLVRRLCLKSTQGPRASKSAEVFFYSRLAQKNVFSTIIDLIRHRRFK